MLKNLSLFVYLSLAMGASCNFIKLLVQFPIHHFGLEEILTYGAFSYPITFLITDLCNRAYGKFCSKKIFVLVSSSEFC